MTSTANDLPAHWNIQLCWLFRWLQVPPAAFRPTQVGSLAVESRGGLKAWHPQPWTVQLPVPPIIVSFSSRSAVAVIVAFSPQLSKLIVQRKYFTSR
jgi:hypothetical protein